MQLVITRDHASIPWGFRLKGGAEYNVPLSILKVNEGSPSHFKLECGDIIANIGNYPALNLKHEEALNIIRMFDLTLPLVIQRQQPFDFNPARILTKSTVTPALWKPASVSSYDAQPASQKFNYNGPQSPKTQSSFANENYSSYVSPNEVQRQHKPQVFQPQAVPSYSSNSYQSPPPQVYQQPQVSVYQPQPQVYQSQFPQSYQQQAYQQMSPKYPPPAPPMPPSAPIPPAPPLPDSFSSGNNFRVHKPVDASYSRPQESSYSKSMDNQSNQVVPDALLKAMNNRSGQKPFSYTPGGLDLSHIRESARVKRYESMNSSSEHQRQVSFNSQDHMNTQQNYQHQPQQQTRQSQSSFNYTNQVKNNSAGSSMASVMNRSNSVNMHSYSSSNENIAPAPRQQRPAAHQPTTAFNITPEQLVKPKPKEENRDLMNQSFSFKMLNKWISDSESSNITLVSKKDEEENQNQKPAAALPNLKKSEVIKALEEDEKKFHPRQSQSPQAVNQSKFNPSYTVPSKAFQYVDRKFSETESSNVVNRKASFSEEQAQNHPRVPARERDQEPSISKYKGTHIPSKSFRYLQYLTQNESVTDESLTNSNNVSVPVQTPILQNAPIQVATSNRSSSADANNNGNFVYPMQSVKALAQANTLVQQGTSKMNSNSVSFPSNFTSEPNPPPLASTTSSFSANIGPSAVAHIASETNSFICSHIDEAIENNTHPEPTKSPAQETNAEPILELNTTITTSENDKQCEDNTFLPSSISISNNETIVSDLNLNQKVEGSSTSNTTTVIAEQSNFEPREENHQSIVTNQVELEENNIESEQRVDTEESNLPSGPVLETENENVNAKEGIVETSEF